MRHRKHGRQLGRNTPQRRALLRSLSASFIRHGTLLTTEAKAKAVKPLIEKLVSQAREASRNSRRAVHAFLQDGAVSRRLEEMVRLSSVQSGWTRIETVAYRRGDAAKMVQLVWSQFPNNQQSQKHLSTSIQPERPTGTPDGGSRPRAKATTTGKRRAGRKPVNGKKRVAERGR